MRSLSPDILLTFIHLDKQLKTPLYLQLYQQVKANILSGMLKQGDRMPSTRSFSEGLGISRNSVLLAFDQLTLEGFLMTRAGNGTFVCDQLNELKINKKRIVALTSSLKELPDQVPNRLKELSSYTSFVSAHSDRERSIPFQPSVTSFADFPFKIWAQIAASVYKKMDQLHLGYDSAQGHLPLREVISEYLRINRAIICTPEQIVIVNGSSQALNLIAELLLSKGDTCWMEDPGYLWAKSAFARFGGEICPIPIGEHGMDLAYAIEKAPKAKLAYVTPGHQFPLGKVMRLSERIQLLKLASNRNMWIIEDDYESEFRYSGRPIPALKGLDSFAKVIYVGTFNKTLFPALRIGYMVMPTIEMAQKISVIKAMTDRQSPIIDQAILTAFIAEGHFLRHLRRMRLSYKKAQGLLIHLLNKHFGANIGISAKEAGMHIMVWFPLHKVAPQLSNQAKEIGILLYAVDELAIKFKHPNAFIMGFTGFEAEIMEQAVIGLKKLLNIEPLEKF